MWKVLQQIRYPAYKRMAARVRKIAKKEDGNESEWIPSCHISKMVKHSVCVCVCASAPTMDVRGAFASENQIAVKKHTQRLKERDTSVQK